jgi:hypothetical protein
VRFSASRAGVTDRVGAGTLSFTTGLGANAAAAATGGAARDAPAPTPANTGDVVVLRALRVLATGFVGATAAATGRVRGGSCGPTSSAASAASADVGEGSVSSSRPADIGTNTDAGSAIGGTGEYCERAGRAVGGGDDDAAVGGAASGVGVCALAERTGCAGSGFGALRVTCGGDLDAPLDVLLDIAFVDGMLPVGPNFAAGVVIATLLPATIAFLRQSGQLTLTHTHVHSRLRQPLRSQPQHYRRLIAIIRS